MNAGMRPMVTSRPFKSPQAAPRAMPVASPTMTAMTSLPPPSKRAFMVSMPTAAPNAMTAPTERSMPPAMMTRVIPTAITPMAAFWFSRFRRFSGLRNVSDWVIAL